MKNFDEKNLVEFKVIENTPLHQAIIFLMFQNNNVTFCVTHCMARSTKPADTWEIGQFTPVVPDGKLLALKNAFAKPMVFGRIKSLFAKNEVSRNF